jgi:CheY-like chemotaxis protein
MKILVADDDPTSRLIARMALQRLGHQCDVATDGTSDSSLIDGAAALA